MIPNKCSCTFVHCTYSRMYSVSCSASCCESTSPGGKWTNSSCVSTCVWGLKESKLLPSWKLRPCKTDSTYTVCTHVWCTYSVDKQLVRIPGGWQYVKQQQHPLFTLLLTKNWLKLIDQTHSCMWIILWTWLIYIGKRILIKTGNPLPVDRLAPLKNSSTCSILNSWVKQMCRIHRKPVWY